MFNVYQSHKQTNILFPPVETLDEARRLADACASLGYDGLFRVFAHTDGPTGEHFVTSFSVIGGNVREHKDVTIPSAHW